MAIACTLEEFRKRCKRWIGLYSGIPMREQEAWSADWLRALRKIRYVKRVGPIHPVPADVMFAHKVIVNPGIASLEGVKADLAKIWGEDIAPDIQAWYATADIDTGFRFYFSAITSGESTLTGLIEIVQNEARR